MSDEMLLGIHENRFDVWANYEGHSKSRAAAMLERVEDSRSEILRRMKGNK